MVLNGHSEEPLIGQKAQETQAANAMLMECLNDFQARFGISDADLGVMLLAGGAAKCLFAGADKKQILTLVRQAINSLIEKEKETKDDTITNGKK